MIQLLQNLKHLSPEAGSFKKKNTAQGTHG